MNRQPSQPGRPPAPRRPAPPPVLPGPWRIVISGGPGAGKTALIDALAATGCDCCAEVSRQLIREQTAAGGSLFPWRDLRGFAAECHRRMGAQLAAVAGRHRVFFDRGLPDVIAYLRHAGHRPPGRLFRDARAYTPIVFLAPPWAAIYVNDPERPQCFAEAVGLHVELERAYAECGFTIVPLPRASVAERVDCIRRTLVAHGISFP